MARKVFYSFRYSIDSQRVAKIKNIGAIEGQPVIDGNKWEEVEKKGPRAVIGGLQARRAKSRRGSTKR